ncbi:hypothetical protein DV736_g259, partial [Chaetothyriales sp. CBS 134916]
MARTKIFRFGIIIDSTRVVRIVPQVADFVLNTIKAGEQKPRGRNAQTSPRGSPVDLATHNLPIFDESGIPQQINIASVEGFIFVSAQHNWGIPLELKNAIDYLFHEWQHKPAMIVTYGGHQCVEQLKTVLGAMGHARRRKDGRHGVSVS